MKKLIICAIMASMLTSYAYAEEMKTVVNSDTRDITISGSISGASLNRLISVEVTSKEDNELTYLGAAPTDAKGEYNFVFRMPEKAETGYYNIALGAYGEKKQTYEIYFAKKADIDALLNIINTAADFSAIRTEIEKNVDVINIPKDRYSELDSDGKDSIAEALYNGREYTSLLDATNIAYNELAVQIFKKAENAQEIKDALAEFAESYNINKDTSKCFELIDNIGTEAEYEQNKDYAYELMAKHACENGVINAYDQSVLIGAINKAKDPDTIKEYLDNDVYRAVLNIDFTYYDKADKNKSVKYLYGCEDFASVTDIEDAFEDAYADQNKYQGGGSGGSSGGSSGGNKSSGGVTNYAPPSVSAPVTTPVKKTFDDLQEAQWAKEAVEYLASEGIVSGMEENKFEPNGLVTREQFVKMLVEAFNLDMEGAVSDFNDLKNTHWAYKAVSSAFARGIVSGIDENNFGTGKNITRQDMAVMTYKAAKAAGKEFNEENTELSFSDKNDIAEYALESVKILNANKVINGYSEDLFAPADTATRAQAAQIIYTIIK